MILLPVVNIKIVGGTFLIFFLEFVYGVVPNNKIHGQSYDFNLMDENLNSFGKYSL